MRTNLIPTQNSLPETTRREMIELLNQQLADAIDLGLQAKQDTSRMGEESNAMVTWAHIGEPVISDGNDYKDAEGIRSSAKACVQAFIDVAKGGE
jgi:hypothetical protein